MATDRNKRQVWAEHRVRLEAGIVPMVPKQAQMRRLLRGCEVVPFDEASAHAAGRPLAPTKTGDIVDAAVAHLGSKHHAIVVTSDPENIRRLLSAARAKCTVIDAGFDVMLEHS